MLGRKRIAAVAGTILLAASIVPLSYARPKGPAHINNRNGIRHVLLISIDGMHALDFLNCSKGISGVNGGQPYCPHLAALGEQAVNYVDASTSKPSDSFPGLMAIVTGGSPRTWCPRQGWTWTSPRCASTAAMVLETVLRERSSLGNVVHPTRPPSRRTRRTSASALALSPIQ